MHLGIRKRLKLAKVRFDVLLGKALYVLADLEAVGLLVKRVNKESAEAILRKFGAEIGPKCEIESGVTIHNAKADFSNLHIGSLCHIGKQVLLDLKAPIYIKERSTISMRTIILTHMDVGHAGPFEEEISRRAMEVEIGPGAYIGAAAIILPGIKIGEGSIVGAGALVREDVPPWTIVAGVPARRIRKIKA